MYTNHFQKVFIGGIIIAIVLVLFGKILAPTEQITGMIAAVTILSMYGLIATFFVSKVKKLNPVILSTAITLGLIAGFIFTSEIILEYILIPKDNTIYGLIEFGSVFLIYGLAGVLVTLKTRHIRYGIYAAFWTAIIATLIWVIVFLTLFYCFYNTPLQMLIHKAEGDYIDFAKSGMKDFNIFIMQDSMGAIFYHSLLGPIIACFIGGIGSLVGKGALLALKKNATSK